jgi:benzoate-CoA ligase family protein
MSAYLHERYNFSDVVERQVNAGRGEVRAVVGEDAVLSYDELRRAINRAGRLLQDLGIEREQRILLALDDTTVFPIFFLGAIRIGAVPVPVSPLDKDDNYRHFVRDSYARVVVTDASLLPRLSAALASEPTSWIVRGGHGVGVIELDDALDAQSDELDSAPTHPDDMAFWLYSSGSTGKPKGVVHLQHDIPVTCENYGKNILRLQSGEVTFSTTKLFHAYGLGNGISFPLWFGATSVLMAGPTKPEPIIETLRRTTPDVFFSVPALYGAIVRHPEAGGALDSVRICLSAAEPLPSQTGDRWRARFGLDIVDGIGSTEMLHIYCSNRSDKSAPGTTGWPVPGYELRLADDDGRVVTGPATGELQVRGDSCAAYYWHQHEKTKRAMVGGWFSSGDRYERREDGTYRYVGRADDMLKVGGLWVSPVDMENVLADHPRVSGVGVVGVTIDGASRVVAYIECTGTLPGDALADELRAWCKDRMRRYEYPHVVVFENDLPRTATGKVQRFVLREHARRAFEEPTELEVVRPGPVSLSTAHE